MGYDVRLSKLRVEPVSAGSAIYYLMEMISPEDSGGGGSGRMSMAIALSRMATTAGTSALATTRCQD